MPERAERGIEGCRGLTAKAVKRLAEKCKGMRALASSAATTSQTLPSRTLRSCARACRRPLHVVREARGRGRRARRERCPGLQSVSFLWGEKLTDEAVKHLAAKCQSLRSVNCR